MKTTWTDAEMLFALRCSDNGWTCEEIGRHLGRSKCSVVGILYRIRLDTDASEGAA